jgi:hypothetical protein
MMQVVVKSFFCSMDSCKICVKHDLTNENENIHLMMPFDYIMIFISSLLYIYIYIYFMEYFVLN